MLLRRVALIALTAFGLHSACRNLEREANLGPSAAGGGNLGGEAGEAGEAGESAQAGTATQSEQGGAAGEPELGGNAGSSGQGADPLAESEPDLLEPSGQVVIAPGCVSGIDQGALNLSDTPSALAANMVPNGVPYVLYGADPQKNMVLLRWAAGASWTAWGCFDTMVYPAQLSAITVYDSPSPLNTPEVYATNRDGRLFVRRYFMRSGWTPWEIIGLPRARSFASDVSASSTPETLPFLYVLDSGRIFTRHHTSIQAYSNYTPWREVQAVPAKSVHLCAGVQTDHRQQLFVLTENGDVFEASQASPEPEAAFGAFQPLLRASTHAMTDIECGYLADGTLTAFGLSSGRVWSHSSAASDSPDWLPGPVSTTLNFTIFAVGSQPGFAPTVFGFDSKTNAVWLQQLGTSSWTPLY